MKKILDFLFPAHGRVAIFDPAAGVQHGKTIGSSQLLRQTARNALRKAHGRLMLICAPVLLGGCFGAGNIDIVKNSVWTAMPDTTIGKALDSRVSCTSPHWREFDDERGRRIVEYSCEFQGAQAKVQGLRDGKAEMLSRHAQWAAEDEERSKTIQNDLKTLESMRDCPAFQPDLLQTKGIGTQLKFEAKRCGRYSRASDDPYVQKWGSLVQQLQGDLQRLARSVDVRREQIAERDDAIARAEAELAILDQEKAQKATAVQDKGASAQAELQNKASAHLKNYKSLREITQWSIVNGEPVHVGSAVELQAGANTITEPIPVSFVINDTRDETPDLARRVRTTNMIDSMWSRYKRQSGG